MTTHPAGHGGKAPDTERRVAVQNGTRAHLRGPWVYAPASEEGSAVVSPPTDDDSVKVWWTAIVDCVDDDVANDIARLMHAAPETAAERDRLKAINGELLAAARKALNYIANTEDELSITLDSGEALRAAIAKAQS